MKHVSYGKIVKIRGVRVSSLSQRRLHDHEKLLLNAQRLVRLYMNVNIVCYTIDT